MKSKVLLVLATSSLLLFCPNLIFGQAPNLGTTSNFALFTAVGEFNNNGPSVVTGDVGTDMGAFNAFPPGTLIGAKHVEDVVSEQAATDVAIAFGDLSGLSCGAGIGATLGNGQILIPNIYCTVGAATLEGNLTLDAQGDPAAIFVIRINGAFATGNSTNILLAGGANLCNVYWQINGQFTLNESSLFLGTLIADGAITLNPASTLNGRALSVAGAITTSSTVVNRSLCLPPTIACAVAVGVSCNNQVPPPDINSVLVTTTCPGVYTVIHLNDLISNQTCPNRYTITRTYQVTDACGETASCSQLITVNDQTSPVLTCPTVVSPLECPAALAFPPATATDLCDASPVITFNDITTPGGICPQEYSVTRTWTATDNCGNSTFCSRTISFTDNTPPVLTCPTVVSPMECPAALAFPPATATDLCDANPVITINDLTTPGGICPQESSVTRTWTATDDCGNSTSCSRTISLTDNTPPVLTCPTVVSPMECPAALAFPPATATDLCDANPLITINDLTTPGGICPQENTVTRTWTATDACGNSTSCSRTISLTDNTPPVLICPIVVSPLECLATPIFPPATATDLCSANPLITFEDLTTPGGICPQDYSVTRTWTATDNCGNSTFCSRTISVSDDTPPVITCPIVVSPILCPAIPAFPPATATDLCDVNPLVTFDDITTPGNTPQEYRVTRTWTAADDCGNFASCSRTIVVEGNSGPILNCPISVPNLTPDGNCQAVLGDYTLLVNASSGCGGSPVMVQVVQSPVAGTLVNPGSVTVYLTVTDGNGQQFVCTFTVTINGGCN